MSRSLTLAALILLAAALPALAQPIAMPLVGPVEVQPQDRVETWHGKNILVFTPHPDDETFSMGGTLALLAENGNKITIVIYTNDDKGSRDLKMTSEQLARIRRAEEEEACRILGIARENIVWLGYEDGNLEYADPQRLRGEAARLIKLHKPDAVFSPDPGVKYDQWHKTDHRMAARITQDAFIAAEWHLYYPQHLLDEGLKPHPVPVAYYFYSQEPNYEIDISTTIDLKGQAAAAHVSQFEPSLDQYTPTLPAEVIQKIKTNFAQRNKAETPTGRRAKKDDTPRYVERFRRVEMP
jgi:LmbE family N-acetylglucosaminyl deacetylase